MSLPFPVLRFAALACLIWPLQPAQQPAQLTAQTDETQPAELGLVHWNRDLVTAKKLSAETGKPMFVLFQEVPGCQTCQDFGGQPMSHPLVVEAIEDLFVPVLVFNNKKSDAELLETFGEPSWNNPVVRFLNADGSDLIPRKDRIWTTSGIVQRMNTALDQSHRPVPEYLGLIADRGTSIEIAEFAMHCYWEGEAQLGSIPGVVGTRSGWRDKLEVVELQFDPQKVDYAKLVDEAQKFECATKIFTRSDAQQDVAKQKVGELALLVRDRMRDAKPSDQKYYLRKTNARHLPLTGRQATKINAAIAAEKKWDQFLSPRQIRILEKIDAAVARDPNALGDLVYPENPNDLPSYAEKLNSKLTVLRF